MSSPVTAPDDRPPGRRPVWRRMLPIVAGVLGLFLFVYAVRQAGVTDIADGIRRVGWGLLAVIALGGCRFLIRTYCWRLCLTGQSSLGVGHAFTAFLAGDAVGSVTPLGLLASEPTKVFLTRHHLATRESAASLTLENLIYSASVFAVVALGAAVLLVIAPLPGPLFRAVALGLVVALAAVAAVPLVLRSRTLGHRLGRLGGRLASIGAVAAEVRRFSVNQPGRLAQVFALDLVYHAVAVVEVYLTLDWLMGGRGPTLPMAIVFETLNRVITVAFKFVPFRIGVDEALSGALAPLVAVDPATGVALAIVRKVRSLFWAGVGLVAIALHPAGEFDGRAEG